MPLTTKHLITYTTPTAHPTTPLTTKHLIAADLHHSRVRSLLPDSLPIAGLSRVRVAERGEEEGAAPLPLATPLVYFYEVRLSLIYIQSNILFTNSMYI